VDVIQVLTENDYQTARKYWKVLKGRILDEAGQPVTICYQFKLRVADKINDLTDNMDIRRLSELTDKDVQRLRKYLQAYRLLV
jgi:hypothetical protein